MRGSLRAIAAVVLVMASSCGAASAPCTTSGGEPGSIVQLRHVSFGNDQLSLLFVQRAGERVGIPEHVIGMEDGVIRIRIPGARLRTADGGSSFRGDLPPLPPPGRIRGVEITEDADGSVTIDLRVDGDGCARVASRRFGLGTTFSAALVSIALRDGPVVALDPDHGVPGTGMQVVGMGFAPSSPVTFEVGPGVVWSSRTDERGELDTVLMIPRLAGRDHSALVRDGAGGTALAWFRID